MTDPIFVWLAVVTSILLVSALSTTLVMRCLSIAISLLFGHMQRQQSRRRQALTFGSAGNMIGEGGARKGPQRKGEAYVLSHYLGIALRMIVKHSSRRRFL